MSKYWPESRLNGKENIWYAFDATTEEHVVLKYFTMSTSDDYKVSREAYTMKYLHKEDPKHFLEMYDFMEDKSEDQYIIAMEKADCSLDDIVNERGYFPEEEAIYILREILIAIKVMHKNLFIHRDLKLSNILLKDRNDLSSIKIIDFGETVERSDEDDVSGMIGTLHYMAPEILENKPYSKPVDIWAFGVIAYRILTGFFPYVTNKYNASKQLEVIYENDLSYLTIDNKILSNKAIDFINNILEPKPYNRISIDTALGHPFLNPNFEGEFVPLKPLPNLTKEISNNYIRNSKLSIKDRIFNKISNTGKTSTSNNDLLEFNEINNDSIIILEENQEDSMSDNSSDVYPLMSRVDSRFNEFKRIKLERYSDFSGCICIMITVMMAIILYYIYVFLILIYHMIKGN
ncbi:kinase-like protein [Anaeromyces robustus]|uniref:Kinase-like protein n=1 Tax=Anaeromyces robustus TaxID=1754192 RepID=A0A1Y1X145_9FUNG|nr:kinase-like protein [Anaeromyces robustus]|eukprot:ORX79531.1 kinase-like protein [Anaeromyces robustus]